MNNSPLEKVIEKKVCDYAKSFGYITYKFNSMNRAAVPDRLFVKPDGKMYFIEFKRGGAKPTPAQIRELGKLLDQEVAAFVIDDIYEGELLVEVIESGVDIYEMALMLSGKWRVK